MTTNERDTHFQHGAEQVWQKLAEIIGEPLVNSSANFEEFQQKVSQIRLILAQYSYDLVSSSLEEMSRNSVQSDQTIDEIIAKEISDLGEWPTPSPRWP